MIPLKDNIPIRRLPLITILLIVVNALVFGIDRLTGRSQAYLQLIRPGIYRQAEMFIGGISQFWSMIPGNIIHSVPGSLWTLLSSMFLHANWLHIGFNMLFLWVFGSNVEDAIGRKKFIVFYLACGVVGGLCHIASEPASMVPTVGASGAIAGLMGAYLVLFPRAEILTIVPVFFFGAVMDVPVAVVIGFSAVIQYVNAKWLGGAMMQDGGIAYFAHLGGFLSGALFIILMGGRKLSESKMRNAVQPTI